MMKAGIPIPTPMPLATALLVDDELAEHF